MSEDTMNKGLPDRHDPAQSIYVTVSLESPQVVKYRLWFRKPGDEKWTKFADGTDHKPAESFKVDPLPKDSLMTYRINFTGNPETAYRAVITLAQDAGEIKEVVIDGVTDAQGAAVKEEPFGLS